MQEWGEVKQWIIRMVAAVVGEEIHETKICDNNLRHIIGEKVAERVMPYLKDRFESKSEVAIMKRVANEEIRKLTERLYFAEGI